MEKLFNKVLVVILAAIVTLSSVPVGSLMNAGAFSPISIVALAASNKTHLNKTKKSMYIGRKYTLKLINSKGKKISSGIKWKTPNKKVATVNSKGVVTAKKAGKVTITAIYKGKKYNSVITVKSAVKVNKTKVTFEGGSTAKKTIKVTCKDNGGIKWKVVSGKNIVKLSQAKKWKNDTKNFYITPTGKKFGKVKIKIYSVQNTNSYVYVYVSVKKPNVTVSDGTVNEAPIELLSNAEALAMFQKAAKEINEKGVAGYTKKSWQTIESSSGNGVMRALIESFITTEEDAEDKVSGKGSEDAMRRMPLSDCTMYTIASIKTETSGSNYIITIVMNDHCNPGKLDTDGLSVMTNDILYMEDVRDTVDNNDAVNNTIKDFNGKIEYRQYTITATMTKDGKFIEIVHNGRGAFDAEATVANSIVSPTSGIIEFNARYWDFKY